MSWRIKRLLVVVSMLAVVGASVAWLIVEALGLDIANDAILRERRELNTLQRRVADLLDEQKNPEQPKSTLAWQLPDQPNIMDALRALETAFRDAGVRAESITPRAIKATGRQTISAIGVGDAMQVARLLAGIEKQRRLVLIETARFAGGEARKVRFELGLVTFYGMGDQ